MKGFQESWVCWAISLLLGEKTCEASRSRAYLIRILQIFSSTYSYAAQYYLYLIQAFKELYFYSVILFYDDSKYQR